MNNSISPLCNNDIDIENNVVPAKWFGQYSKDKLVKIICRECLLKNTKVLWCE
jgi:hypothetical protein